MTINVAALIDAAACRQTDGRSVRGSESHGPLCL